MASTDLFLEQAGGMNLNSDKLIFIIPFSIVVFALLLVLFFVAKMKLGSSGSTTSSSSRKKGSRSDSSRSSMIDTESMDGAYDGFAGSESSGHRPMYGGTEVSGFTNNSSGAGAPLLVQKTIAIEIKWTDKVIGAGRYGDVLLAKLRGDNVAVKIFKTTEESSWQRERDIYNSVLLNHGNLLGFIAADIRGTGGTTQMLLITEYHPNGSLYDYLCIKLLTEFEALKLMYSAIKGLDHLHSEVNGIEFKGQIAHRDIKSKNILVKTDGECCIADFGLCVLYDKQSKNLDIGINTRVGTKRYMAPEVLDETLVQHDFQSYKRADIYSFTLVLWEIARKCHTDGKNDLFDDHSI